MIFVAATVIVWTSIQRLLNPQPLHVPGLGLAISSVAALINLFVGLALLRAGRRHRSMTLVADGKHLLTDVATSVGVLVGVALGRHPGLGAARSDRRAARRREHPLHRLRAVAQIRHRAARCRPAGRRRRRRERGVRSLPGGRARRLPRLEHARVRAAALHLRAPARARTTGRCSTATTCPSS